jgi:ABC-type polysaccharide/polyol phosphate transport system ATPase subunit
MTLAPGQIKAEGLGRKFKIAATGGRSLRATLLRYEQAKPREFWALRNVNLDIEPGETFGIVGRNGSGKSTLLKMLARIFGPTEGYCETGGRISSLLELGAGFHQDFSAIENVYLSAAIYGIPREEIHRELDEIIGFAELEEFAHQPVKTFSSGMFARLGFSVAMHVRPDVLLLDEVLAVGDEPFVQKCMGRIAQFRREGGTMVLVTHDPGTVERMCSRALFLERGEPVMIGGAHDVIERYHEHLAAENTAIAPDGTRDAAADIFAAHVDVVGIDGELRHRFTEGEPFEIRLALTAFETVDATRVTLTFRDELGREIGSHFVDHRSFLAHAPKVLTLTLGSSPLRNGQFGIDIGVNDLASGRPLLTAPAIESVSVLGQRAESSGPVQMGGTWRVD